MDTERSALARQRAQRAREEQAAIPWLAALEGERSAVPPPYANRMETAYRAYQDTPWLVRALATPDAPVLLRRVVQPPVGFGRWERVWRWVLGR